MPHGQRVLGIGVFVLASACLIVHMAVMVTSPNVAAVVMVALAGACLICAGHAFKHGRDDEWAFMVILAMIMIVIHLSIHGARGHHTSSSPATGSSMGELSLFGLVISSLELIAGGAALIVSGIRRRVLARGES